LADILTMSVNNNISLIDHIQGTCLIKYYLDNPNDLTLTHIFRVNHDKSMEFQRALCLCYEYIIAEDRVDIINYVISNNTKNDHELNSICIAAIYKNKIPILELLTDINYNYNTIINRCMLNEDTIFDVRFNIMMGWSINTPLSYSCALSNLEIVDFLINSGADIRYGGSAFNCVCINNNIEILNYFFKFDFNYDTVGNGFIKACLCKNMNIVDCIIDHVHDIKLYSDQIFIGLAYEGTLEVIQYLLDRGLTINSNEPLKYACKNGNIPLIDFYLARGLDVDGDIILVVLRKFNIAIIKLFLDYHVNFSRLDNSMNKYDEMLRLLEQNGLNINLLVNYLIHDKQRTDF
jgi:ankyrin repeat protein